MFIFNNKYAIDDDKLIVSKEGKKCFDDAIRALTEFQEKYFESIIIR